MAAFAFPPRCQYSFRTRRGRNFDKNSRDFNKQLLCE